jgi:hypothetical protein
MSAQYTVRSQPEFTTVPPAVDYIADKEDIPEKVLINFCDFIIIIIIIIIIIRCTVCRCC